MSVKRVLFRAGNNYNLDTDLIKAQHFLSKLKIFPRLEYSTFTVCNTALGSHETACVCVGE